MDKAELKRADQIRQAILKRAFEGKLVPQDPTDEPASVLLARIRAERDAKPGVGTRRMSRRRRGTTHDGAQLTLPVDDGAPAAPLHRGVVI